jgi:hypothetical protein
MEEEGREDRRTRPRSEKRRSDEATKRLCGGVGLEGFEHPNKQMFKPELRSLGVKKRVNLSKT